MSKKPTGPCTWVGEIAPHWWVGYRQTETDRVFGTRLHELIYSTFMRTSRTSLITDPRRPASQVTATITKKFEVGI